MGFSGGLAPSGPSGASSAPVMHSDVAVLAPPSHPPLVRPVSGLVCSGGLAQSGSFFGLVCFWVVWFRLVRLWLSAPVVISEPSQTAWDFLAPAPSVLSPSSLLASSDPVILPSPSAGLVIQGSMSFNVILFVSNIELVDTLGKSSYRFIYVELFFSAKSN